MIIPVLKDFHRALSKDSIQTQGDLYFANKPLTFFLMHHFKILPKSSFVRHVFGLFSSRLWRTSKTTSWTVAPIERVNRKAWQVYIIIFWHFLFYRFTFRRSTSSIYIIYSFKLWFLQYLCSAEFIIFLSFLFIWCCSFVYFIEKNWMCMVSISFAGTFFVRTNENVIAIRKAIYAFTQYLS